MLAVMLEGLGLKVELILERILESHRGLILGARVLLFMVALQVLIAECSRRLR